MNSRCTFEDEPAVELAAALRSTGYLELFDIEVIVDDNDVWLRGRVPNSFLKQKTEFTIRSISDIASLRSDIEVVT